MSDDNKKYVRYGNIIYWIVRLIESTLRTKIIFTEKYDENKNFIMTCWHNKLLMGLLGTKFIKKRATLVSPSK
ncbi:MAG: hypothetical protein ACRCSK_05580, partial [Fusobacteriaceae bacterium]